MRVVSLDLMNDELVFKCQRIKFVIGFDKFVRCFVSFFKISYDGYVEILTCSSET